MADPTPAGVAEEVAVADPTPAEAVVEVAAVHLQTSCFLSDTCFADKPQPSQEVHLQLRNPSVHLARGGADCA